ncbi:MAG: hypothetical protein ACXVQS_10610 [Actinomycetota bacterium]
MFRRIALVGVLSAAMVSVAVGSATALNREVLHATNLHPFPAKGASGAAGTVSLLSWHGGPVQHATSVNAIFWGSSWPTYTGDKVTGIDAFYGGVTNTNYAKTNTEYTDGSGNVSPAVSYGGHLVDGSSAPRHAPSTGSVLAEVAKMYPNPTPGGYYPVYVDQKRGHAGYCAWHSAGTINGVAVQFAFFFNLDGDPGCDPGTTLDSKTGSSQGLAALGNVTGHELSEMLTDPRLNAWYDGSGAENADKCAWTFSGKTSSFGGKSWIIQGNWSNNAYTSNSGYVRGCIDGN